MAGKTYTISLKTYKTRHNVVCGYEAYTTKTIEIYHSHHGESSGITDPEITLSVDDNGNIDKDVVLAFTPDDWERIVKTVEMLKKKAYKPSK